LPVRRIIHSKDNNQANQEYEKFSYILHPAVYFSAELKKYRATIQRIKICFKIHSLNWS
jgi:hypothetical protein